MLRIFTAIFSLFTVMLLSCDGTGNKTAGANQTDSAMLAKDTTLADAAVLPPIPFNEFLPNISAITLPLDREGLKETALKTLYGRYELYTDIKAGRFALPDGNTMIVYAGQVDSDIMEVWMITYTSEGKEIVSIKEGGYHNERSGVEEPERTEQHFTIHKDTLIEIREHYLKWAKTQTTDTTAIRFYQVQADGKIGRRAKDNESFAAYQERFPLLQLPLTIKKVSYEGLTPVSKLTPYYRFEDYIYFDWRVYAYGRVHLPGKGPVLLYVNEAAEEGEAIIAPSVELVSYSPGGAKKDLMKIAGGDGGEGGYTDYTDTRITPEGIIALTESTVVHGEYLEFNNTHTITYDMQYQVDASGKFAPVGATRVEYRLTEYGTDNMKAYFDRKKEEPSGDWEEVQFTIPGSNKIVVGIYSYYKNGECLMELFTSGKDNEKIDTYPLYNTLKTARYEDVAFLKLENESEGETNRGALMGPVIIKLKDKTLQIDRQGRFIK